AAAGDAPDGHPLKVGKYLLVLYCFQSVRLGLPSANGANRDIIYAAVCSQKNEVIISTNASSFADHRVAARLARSPCALSSPAPSARLMITLDTSRPSLSRCPFGGQCASRRVTTTCASGNI